MINPKRFQLKLFQKTKNLTSNLSILHTCRIIKIFFSQQKYQLTTSILIKQICQISQMVAQIWVTIIPLIQFYTNILPCLSKKLSLFKYNNNIHPTELLIQLLFTIQNKSNSPIMLQELICLTKPLISTTSPRLTLTNMWSQLIRLTIK